MTEDQNNENRRDFLARCVKAGLAVAGASAAGFLLHDRIGPSGSSSDQGVKLPDFSVPDAGKKMAIITGSDRSKTVAAGLKAVGGIESFVKKGDRVMLKVNAAFASPAMLSATTHGDLVYTVAQLCLAAGAASVVVTDNSINDPQSCFDISGLSAAAKRAGASVLLPKESSFRPITVPNAKLICDWPLLHEPFAGVTKVIGIAPVKHHERAGASMTMKNWYGLLGGRRNKFHQDINNTVAELAMMVQPTLVILDGTTTMMRNGPTGGSLEDLKATNTMIVSTDQVAADTFGASLLGRTMHDLPYLSMAAATGAGTTDFESLRPVRAEAK